MTTRLNEDGLTSGDSTDDWISSELLDETRRVWAKHYGRDVSVEEATEILRSIKRLADLFVAYKNGSR